MTDPQEAATPSDPHSAEALAQAFHENYERLAPSFGYETRNDSAVEWADVPEPNKSLMIAVAAALIEQGRVSRDAEVAELKAKMAELEHQLKVQAFEHLRDLMEELGGGES